MLSPEVTFSLCVTGFHAVTFRGVISTSSQPFHLWQYRVILLHCHRLLKSVSLPLLSLSLYKNKGRHIYRCTLHHSVRAYKGHAIEYHFIILSTLSSTLYGCKLSISRPSRLAPGYVLTGTR